MACDPPADPAVIARMSEEDWAEYWAALGTVTRLTARHAAAVAAEQAREKFLLDGIREAGKEINNTAATTQIRPNYETGIRTPRPIAIGFRSTT